MIIFRSTLVSINTRASKIKMANFFCVALILLLLPIGALSDEIKSVLDKEIYRHAQYGIHVIDTANGDEVYALNSDRLFYPASLIKLFSTASALSHLGRDFKFETTLYQRGRLTSRGTLEGDLILVPSGDIFFHAIDLLVQKVTAARIKEIKGEVIVDDRFFPSYQAYSSVTPGLILYTVSPATIALYQLEITLTPTRTGEKVRLDRMPNTTWPVIRNEVYTTPEEDREIDISWPDPGVLKVSGKMGINAGPLKKTVGVLDPGSFLRSLLIKELKGAQIKVKASPLTPNPRSLLPPPGEYGKKLKLVASFLSPPLSQYVKRILETSHNPGADALLITMGHSRAMGTMAEGMKVVREFLREMGIPLDTVSMGDGAGISPANLVTPRTVTSFLGLLTHHPLYPEIWEALPVLGLSGTLKRTTNENIPKGKIRAKTGTLNQYDLLNDTGFVQCKSLAGYVETASGRKLAFCFIINGAHITGLRTKSQIIKLAQEVGEDLVRMGEILYWKY